jgi:hypothetical protein
MLIRVYGVAGPTGIEPATYGLRVRRSGLTELRARDFVFVENFTYRFRGFGFFCEWLICGWDFGCKFIIQRLN